MTEHDLQQDILRELTMSPSVRLYRNNCGVGWAGRMISHSCGRVLLADARPLHAGLFAGSADLIGWKTVTITPQMIGRRLAVFASIECKGPHAKTLASQLNWHDVVFSAGGLAAIVKTVDGAKGALIV